MHPRNVYKNSISFSQLAKENPNFAKCLKGASSIDFHDPESIRQLAKALLRKDFNLQVELPEDRLCPAVFPKFISEQKDNFDSKLMYIFARLNYILWLSDLLVDTHTHIQSAGPPKVTGVDMYIYIPKNKLQCEKVSNLHSSTCSGTGASAIYPLLGCAQFPHWNFIATEIDPASLLHASKNIQQNSLETRITLVDVSHAEYIFPKEVTESAESIDFTMCNPPFYSSVNDMMSSAKLKSVPPLSACTGSTTEMVTEGGEVAFVGRIIDESLKLREKVRWYTSMLGKLTSVEKVVDKLKENEISNYVVGEFVQGVGKTKRWAVGWSFGDARAGDHVSRQPTSQTLKSHLPFPTTFRIPLPIDSNLSTLLPRVEELLKASCSDFPTDLFEWSSVRFPCFTTMYGAIENLYSNGKGETSGNTWSRAARRRRKQLESKDGNVSALSSDPKFGFAIGIFIGATVPISGDTQKSNVKDKEDGKKDEEEDKMVDETGAWDHDFISLPASSVEPEASKGSFVLVRWTRGLDQVTWESFCGMLRRKVVDGLAQMKA
ncbi:hypothetical protein AA313_de0201915 [Arthrobotrys entomopaga]|nr:hypothetical protein AA313_de0201915 [Arthrobotrys entomopaga]